MKRLSHLVQGCFLVLLGSTASVRADDKVIVHEWGTFTCLQDERGQAIGGINVDDEPVPHFVYGVATSVARQYTGDIHYEGGNLGLPPYSLGKAWSTPGDLHITMRLETPVIYLYPPKGETAASVPLLDVHVDFHGGVLGEFYPHAVFAGLPYMKFDDKLQASMNGRFPIVGRDGITSNLTTSLDWKNVRLGSLQKPVESDDKVWTSPREVSAPSLELTFTEKDFNNVDQTSTQSEKFLFYRGVGHLDSPLSVMPSSNNANLWNIGAKESPREAKDQLAKIAADSEYPASWLAEIRPDGTCAYRGLASFDERKRNEMLPYAIQTAKFEEADFNAQNLELLKSSMQQELVAVGLYPDEASAMLRTWDLSYFKSPGLRFFYIAPRAWVDAVLPLTVKGAPSQVTRVMIGRIELISDAQRAVLARFEAGPCPDLAAVKRAAFDALAAGKRPDAERWSFYSGERPLSDLGISIPPPVRDYLSLGRFRDALIVHEQSQNPSAVLAQFINENGLIPEPSAF